MSSFKGGGLQLRNKIIVPTPEDKSSIVFVKDGRIKVVDENGDVKDLAFLNEISESEGGGVVITEDIQTNVDVGALKAGQILLSGTNLTELTKRLTLSTFTPTFIPPSSSLIKNIPNNVEAGTFYPSILLTMNFNRGSINGVMSGGVWNPSTKQNDRAGAATEFIINSNNLGVNNNLTLNNIEIGDEATTWTASVSHLSGPQPLDSNGANFSSPLSAGTLNSSTTINGRRNLFFGVSTTETSPFNDSDDIRTLQNSVLNPSNNTTFTINIPVGTSMVVFAYPATLRQVNSVKFVEFSNTEIKEAFTETTVEVDGANGFTPINYRVYTFVPVEPFSQTATYTITI